MSGCQRFGSLVPKVEEKKKKTRNTDANGQGPRKLFAAVQLIPLNQSTQSRF